ncbi:MAG: transglycosylase SLT domain-containing protein [Parvibaculaceae bacterium]|nr:transglycosylase SLT domain-containing protein [Parvibaculaceae bacterium]
MIRRHSRFITALAFSLCSIWLLPSPADAFPARYDAEIEQAVKRWWPDYPDHLAWKAQLWQESRLDPAAVSPAGAAGVAQFMPATWADVVRELRLPRSASRHEASLAIEAGAYYMARLRRSWSSPRPQAERHRLAQASYNAGLGNILRAQKLCGGARLWDEISPCLPRITGRHSKETIDYVRLIAQHRARMAAGGAR